MFALRYPSSELTSPFLPSHSSKQIPASTTPHKIQLLRREVSEHKRVLLECRQGQLLLVSRGILVDDLWHANTNLHITLFWHVHLQLHILSPATSTSKSG